MGLWYFLGGSPENLAKRRSNKTYRLISSTWGNIVFDYSSSVYSFTWYFEVYKALLKKNNRQQQTPKLKGRCFPYFSYSLTHLHIQSESWITERGTWQQREPVFYVLVLSFQTSVFPRNAWIKCFPTVLFLLLFFFNHPSGRLCCIGSCCWYYGWSWGILLFKKIFSV